MLERRAETLGLKRSPDDVLEDALQTVRVSSRSHAETTRKGKDTNRGMLGPLREAVLVERELGLELGDDGLVLEEEDGAVAVREAVDPALGGSELLGGDDALEDVQGDLPELLVLGAKEKDRLKWKRG